MTRGPWGGGSKFPHKPGLVFGVGRAQGDERELRVLTAEGDQGHLSVAHSSHVTERAGDGQQGQPLLWGLGEQLLRRR